MRELPTGTVTLLFSDIQGSTALLRRLGEHYGEALSAQRSLMRTAISDSHGREMGTEGDSFYVVFESAADAVECSLAAQRALAAHRWPDGVAVRVRMGMHSGEPAQHEDGYVGIDVHRAARIAAAAHGGQVVLSDATRILVQSRLPAGVSLVDLGWHRLKDIEAPERIYQLAGPGLAHQFPPLKSLGAQTRLPVPPTPLVGREADIDQLRDTILRPGVRLVTLTGTGGVGKTRLALAAAVSLGDEYEHNIYFVALATVYDSEIMWKAIAEDLNVSGDQGPQNAVTEYLGDLRALLVVDNLEQLAGAAGVVGALLADAPRLVVLATSRRPLHLQSEYELPVPPLALPAGHDAAGVAASGAVQLFVQQASMVRPGFAVTPANAADIAAICRRLDGLPLAIELAAARVRLLSPRAILSRLGDSLVLAASDVGRPSRQQTLRATIAWSYDLLSKQAADMLSRAGVFCGGTDLEALAAVAVPADGIAVADPLHLVAELQDVSLVTVTEGADGEPRVSMLETIREFALDRLRQAGHLDDTRRLHAEYYAGVAERAQRELFGPAQLASLDRLEAEHDDLRAALAWSLESQGAGALADTERTEIGLRLAQALGPFWNMHGHAAEGRPWLERAIELAADDEAPVGRIAYWLGMLLLQQGDLEGARALLERSLAVWRVLGELEQQARALSSLGGTHRRLGNLDVARTVLEECLALARSMGSRTLLAGALTNLGQVDWAAGDFDRAAQSLHEALELRQSQGDMNGAAVDVQLLALISLLAGRPAEARQMHSGVLGYVASSGDAELLADVLELAACISAELGEGLRAARLAGAAEAVREAVGMPIPQDDADLLEQFLAPARASVAPATWAAELAAGRALTKEQAARLLV